MGGGAPKTQTVTNRTEIDPVTQAWRQQLINQGGALYNQGPAQYYPGNTVVPFSNQTQQGLNYLQGYAQQGVPNMGMSNFATTRALSGFNPAMGNAAQMAGENVAQNPYLRGLFDQGAGMVQDRVNTQFAQAGRYGPSNAAHTGALTRGLGDLYSQIYAPAYEAAQNRRLQATGLMGDIWSQGNADAARAQALMPSMYSLGMMPGQSMLDIGSIYEGQAQNYMDADRQRWDYNQNAPWANLERYAGIVNGLPDFSGSSQTSPVQQPNRLMQGLGIASTAASILPTAMKFLPMMFSDRRLKTDVSQIGTDARGLNWYDYRYVWDAPGTVRTGVMADEAPAHAVHVGPGGFLMVNYGAL